MKPTQNRQPVAFERRGPAAPRTPFKPKAWNHQNDLKDAVGKTIAISFDVETKEAFTLLAADQFTLKVRSLDVEDKSVLTFFKGALLGYEIVD